MDLIEHDSFSRIQSPMTPASLIEQIRIYYVCSLKTIKILSNHDGFPLISKNLNLCLTMIISNEKVQPWFHLCVGQLIKNYKNGNTIIIPNWIYLSDGVNNLDPQTFLFDKDLIECVYITEKRIYKEEIEDAIHVLPSYRIFFNTFVKLLPPDESSKF